MKLANLKARVSNFVKNNTKFVTGFMGTIALFTIVAISSVEISSSEFSAKANTLTNSSSESSTVVATTSVSPKVTTTSATTTSVKTTTTTKATTKKVVKKSVTEAALEVIKGKYGNGEERKKKLEKEGFKYEEVQNIVNKLMSGQEVPSIVVSDQESDSSYTEESTNYYENNDYSYNTESNDDNSSSDSSIGGGTSYVKNFSRGTYYPAGYGACGGSGRSLIDCSWGDGNVQGSIASSYLYNTYGYNYGSSGRTTVYLEVNDCPEMSGYYYVDDCDAGNPNVIDFFYNESGNCPFQYQGILQDVDCYIVE